MRINKNSQKGITMVTLTIAIVILILISNLLIYNAKDGVYAQKLESMYNDVESLKGKVMDFYVKYGEIPAYSENEYDITGNEDLYNNWVSEEEKQNGKFYVIDLKALQAVTLNYGKDYDQISKNTSTEELKNYTDLYIINNVTQNIFYVKGVSVEGEKYYSDHKKDDTQIDLKYPKES